MTSLTTLEREVLVNGIAKNDFNNGDLTQAVWTETIEDFCSVSGKQLSGVMSNLAQKGLVVCHGKGRDAVVELTAAGIALLAELGVR